MSLVRKLSIIALVYVIEGFPMGMYAHVWPFYFRRHDVSLTELGWLSGLYIAWFDHASGNYDVYLQLLDRLGNEQWDHNGILISDHAQNSWLVDWDLIVDSQDNVVLVFPDARDGTDLDIHAYKLGPGGEMLWGDHGVTLSENDDYEPSPRVTEASDGDLVFAWARIPDVGDGHILMQRLSPTLR